jgi:hypothetical protein
MANNSKHIASIISSAFTTSKCNDNIVSTSAVDFNNNVLKQHWDYMDS